MQNDTKMIYGGIEGGGTKFVCAVGTGPENIIDQINIPTTSPEQTMALVVDFFKEQEFMHGALSAIGFGCFGPLDPNTASPTYGHILPTPKPGWTNANVVGILKDSFDVPIAFDTDVNAAALGEWHWGMGQGLKTFIYLTIGTGIGGGAYVEGKLLHGLVHPEMGHIPLPHDRIIDPFEGACPFHKDCFEGLASGVAIEQRWGQPGGGLAADHPAWDLEADYIARALTSYSFVLSPERIIVGGGVGQLPHLLPRIRQRTRKFINDYIQSSVILEKIETYITHPGLGNRSGVLGAFALAKQAVPGNP
jgi:fructokinase